MFISPALDVYKNNVKTEISDCGKFELRKDVCKFCGQRSGFNFDRHLVRKDNCFGYDQVVSSACCEKMRETLENCRSLHEKAYLRHFMGLVEENSTPQTYRGLNLVDLKKYEHQKKAYEKIKQYFKGGMKKGFYLFSEKNGTGKTATACIISKVICAYNGWKSFKFVNYSDFVLNYETMSFEEKGQAIEMYKTCNLLVIDDLGKGRVTPSAVSNIYSIVNHRNMNNLLTIITSNMKISDISQNFDSSVASRLFEMTDVIELNGKDLRLN